MKKKSIAIIGSTGSIGTNTLEVARHLGSDYVEVVALVAHSNVSLIAEQIKEFSPEIAVLYDKKSALELKKMFPKQQILSGMEGVVAAATLSSANLVVSAMVGTKGLIPTIEAIKAGKDVALANKEALVSGGALVMALAKEHGVTILPVDSEHSALFQCLQGEEKSAVRRLILTASGGPFRNHTKKQLEEVGLEEALSHPTWSMGKKVTIDSSTLMNKGLEVIEAHWLFGVPLEQIEVIIHPQSVIHSMVEYVDGSMIAQMSQPTMLVPIQYALSYPKRLPGLLKKFDFLKHSELQFYSPDVEKFRCLQLAFDAIKEGGTLPCYMNAANEVLVERFIQKEISWQSIATKLDQLMSSHKIQLVQEVADILEVDTLARREASKI